MNLRFKLFRLHLSLNFYLPEFTEEYAVMSLVDDYIFASYS